MESLLYKTFGDSIVISGKHALLLILLVVTITIIDSQFVNTFYGTNLGSPNNLHLLLFGSFVIIALVINIILLHFSRKKYTSIKTDRKPLFKASYVITSVVQYTIFTILFITLGEIIVIQGYSKIISLLVVYLSHFCVAAILGLVSITFIQWFRIVRSFAILTYGIVFIVVIFLLLITIPLTTEQYTERQPNIIHPIDYILLIGRAPLPSDEIAFIFSLGNFVLPLMIIFMWILTTSLLKPYINNIGKIPFWILVSIPLIYQLFTFLIRDANLTTDLALDILYSRPFQFLMSISYHISGLFFALAFLALARKTKRKVMKNYLIISSLGIVLLFSSMQPGMPFYTPYPPFGLVTLSLLGLSSYLLLEGFLGCAAYVSRDSKLKRELQLDIRSDILNKMGTAEMQYEIERRILPLVKKIELSDDMRDQMDPSDEDVRLMIDEILKEMHKS